MGWRLAGEDGIDVGMEGVREQFSWEGVWVCRQIERGDGGLG